MRRPSYGSRETWMAQPVHTEPWGRQGREGVTVAVIGVTGDKCADCGLLIGTKTYIYNQWLKLGAEHSHLAKSSPHTKDTCTV